MYVKIVIFNGIAELQFRIILIVLCATGVSRYFNAELLRRVTSVTFQTMALMKT